MMRNGNDNRWSGLGPIVLARSFLGALIGTVAVLALLAGRVIAGIGLALLGVVVVAALTHYRRD
jgi:hypothetical protein